MRLWCASPSDRRAEPRAFGAGDHIVAIYGLPLPPSMPVNEATLAAHADDPAYIAMGNLLFGGDNTEIPLTVRSSGRQGPRRHGHYRRTAYRRRRARARHFAQAAEFHRSPSRPRLSIPSVGGVAASPPQLDRRRQLDPFAGRPSQYRGRAALVGLPRPDRRAATASMSRFTISATSCCLPASCCSRTAICHCVDSARSSAFRSLFFLHGTIYETLFVLFMITAVLSLVRWLHKTELADQRQQIRWALLGISGYAVLRCISIVSDYLKWSTVELRPATARRNRCRHQLRACRPHPSARPLDRSSALSPLRRGGRDRPVGELRRDHTWCRGHLCGRRRCA